MQRVRKIICLLSIQSGLRRINAPLLLRGKGKSFPATNIDVYSIYKMYRVITGFRRRVSSQNANQDHHARHPRRRFRFISRVTVAGANDYGDDDGVREGECEVAK